MWKQSGKNLDPCIELLLTIPEQIQYLLNLVDKTIKFTQLTEIHDEVYKAVQGQRQVTEAAQERLQLKNTRLTDLEAFKTTGALMLSLAAEANKLVIAFFSLATKRQDLNGQIARYESIGKTNIAVSRLMRYFSKHKAARSGRGAWGRHRSTS